jgi:hypothetical protein
VDTSNVVDVESHVDAISNSIAIALERYNVNVAKWERTRDGAPALGTLRASNELGELKRSGKCIMTGEGDVLWGMPSDGQWRDSMKRVKNIDPQREILTNAACHVVVETKCTC